MRTLNFLTSRLFAVILLALSAIIMVAYELFGAYSPVYLAVPFLVFLSIASCTIRRFFAPDVERGIPFAGSIIFHVGMLVVIAAVAVAPIVKYEASVYLPKNVPVSTLGSGFMRTYFIPANGRIPDMHLTLEWMEVDYAEGWSPVDYAAGVTVGHSVEGEYSSSEEIIRVNEPLTVNGFKVLLVDGELSPFFTLKDKDGNAVFEQFVSLLNDTRYEDEFSVEAAGLTFHTRFFPDVFKAEDGSYGTKSRYPRNPAFGIKAVRDLEPFKDISKGVVGLGEELTIDGYTLSFDDLQPIVRLKILRDPTYIYVFIGLILITLGLIVRYVPLLSRRVAETED